MIFGTKHWTLIIIKLLIGKHRFIKFTNQEKLFKKITEEMNMFKWKVICITYYFLIQLGQNMISKPIINITIKI